MMAKVLQQTGYGLSQAIQALAPNAVVAQRIPTTADFGYPLGQVWVAKNVPSAYVLVSVAANVALWQLVAPAGAGSFTTVTSTGQFNLDTVTAAANTLGNTNGATSIAVSVGTGGFSVDGVATSNYSIGASTISGTITIGGTGASTGAITLGNSTAAQTVNIALGSGGSKTVVVASGTAGNTVGINNGANTVANVTSINNGAYGANSTVSILTGVGTAGTATFELLSNSAQTQNALIAIGNGGSVGGATNSLTIGSIGGNSSTVIQASDDAAVGGIALNAAGNVSVQPATAAAAAYAVTLDARVGGAILTGQVLAAAATQVLAITNLFVTPNSQVLVTVANFGANDAQLTVTRVEPTAGVLNVTVKNNGAQALNGDINVNFWILD